MDQLAHQLKCVGLYCFSELGQDVESIKQVISFIVALLPKLSQRTPNGDFLIRNNGLGLVAHNLHKVLKEPFVHLRGLIIGDNEPKNNNPKVGVLGGKNANQILLIMSRLLLNK